MTSSARLTTMRRALLVILASLLTVALPGAASAGALAPCRAECSCAYLPLQEQIRTGDVVLVGTVTDEARPARRTGPDQEVVYTLEVDEAIQGDVTATVEVSTSVDSAACGIGLMKGERYLIVAGRADGRLRTTLCSGTGPATSARVAEARAAVPAAEQGTVTPTTDEPSPAAEGAEDPEDATGAESPSLVPVTVLVGGALLLGAAVLGVLAVRRRRADGP